MRPSNPRWMGIRLLIVCLVAGAGLNAVWMSSAQAVLPPRPDSCVSPDDDGEEFTPAPVAKQISLRVRPADKEYWSVVQWQDAHGIWQDVPNWRGAVKNGQISWWVEEKDWGKGPFRWAVYQEGSPIIEQEGRSFFCLGDKALLATSQSFYLPSESQQAGSVQTVSVD